MRNAFFRLLMVLIQLFFFKMSKISLYIRRAVSMSKEERESIPTQMQKFLYRCHYEYKLKFRMKAKLEVKKTEEISYRRTEKKKSWRKKKNEKKQWREDKLLSQLVRPESGPISKSEELSGEDDGAEVAPTNSKSTPNDGVKTFKVPSRYSAGFEATPSFSSSIFTPQTEDRRKRTVSIALPASILDNAQSQDLRTYLAGQIARALVIFQVDEVIIFDENAQIKKSDVEKFNEGFNENTKGKVESSILLCSILQFLDCPQYLRKSLFPLRKHLKYAGVLNPLDAPHHLRRDDLSIPYREAVVMEVEPKEGKGSFCDAGLSKPVQIHKRLDFGIRLTLKLKSSDLTKSKLKGAAVRPGEPREDAGIYWGYSVRLAASLGGVFRDSPYPDGYDLTIGTSEKGKHVAESNLSPGKHTLIVFGGLKGLESCLENDLELTEGDPAQLFNHYLNTCPSQGSRTIRTEEAILISLSLLKEPLSL